MTTHHDLAERLALLRELSTLRARVDQLLEVIAQRDAEIVALRGLVLSANGDAKITPHLVRVCDII